MSMQTKMAGNLENLRNKLETLRSIGKTHDHLIVYSILKDTVV